MLRKRLLLALSALVILLLTVGTAGLLLLRSASTDFDRKLKDSLTLIMATQRFRHVTSTINTSYLAPLADDFDGRAPDRKVYDKSVAEMDTALTTLQNGRCGERAQDAVAQLAALCSEYREGYEAFFANYPKTRAERGAALQQLSRSTQRITDSSESARLLYAEQLFFATDTLAARSMDRVLLIFLLMVAGVLIATLIYFHLSRAIIDPVSALAHSIQEVKRGNFDFSLPEPTVNNELSALIPAFNAMAAELRQSRREADENLRLTNLQNRAVLTAIPAPVFVLNEDASIDQLNPAAEVLLARLGIHDRLPAPLMSLLDDCIRNRRNYLPEDIREAALLRIDEEEHYFLPRIFRFSTEDGGGVWWAVILMDATRFRWLDEMKTNLLATVSHEIKTPLTGIRMVLHLLLEGRTGDLTPIQQKMVGSARDDCERLLVTLKRLLDLVRVESGASQLMLRPVRLSDTLERVRELFASSAHAKRSEILVEAEEDVPPVLADPVRLDEVIQNLVSNALKHGPEGAPVTLRLTRRAGSRFARVSVIDHGPGIPEEMRNRIFDKFFRVPGQKTEGVGLGLSIAREIVLAHGGRIGLVDGGPVNGTPEVTEFHVDLPIAPDDNEE